MGDIPASNGYRVPTTVEIAVRLCHGVPRLMEWLNEDVAATLDFPPLIVGPDAVLSATVLHQFFPHSVVAPKLDARCGGKLLTGQREDGDEGVEAGVEGVRPANFVRAECPGKLRRKAFPHQ